MEWAVDTLPEHLRRYPNPSGREGLAARLGLTVQPYSQDWEWEVAKPEHFTQWLATYRDQPLSDDERFSLMEMLIQCVEDFIPYEPTPEVVESLPEWNAVASLLRLKPHLHASSIVYWSVFGENDPEALFRLSVPMRRIWAEVKESIV
jgi:hypothetical protein